MKTKSEKNSTAGSDNIGAGGLAGFLKEKRQSKNLSLEKLSELTKIQVYHLEALEAGQFEKLPAAIYRTGIYRRLSKFLDVDESSIMEAYNGTEFLPSVKPLGGEPVSKKKSYFIITPKKLTVFFGGLLLILLSGYIWYQFNFLIGPPNLTIEPNGDLVTKEGAVLINGKTDGGVDLTVNGENIYVASNGSFSKEVQLANGNNIVEVKAINNFGKITKIIKQVFREAQ